MSLIRVEMVRLGRGGFSAPSLTMTRVGILLSKNEGALLGSNTPLLIQYD
jgi:hypothetical protein